MGSGVLAPGEATMTSYREQLLELAGRASADAAAISDPALKLLLLQIAVTCRDWAQRQAPPIGPRDSARGGESIEFFSRKSHAIGSVR